MTDTFTRTKYEVNKAILTFISPDLMGVNSIVCEDSSHSVIRSDLDENSIVYIVYDDEHSVVWVGEPALSDADLWDPCEDRNQLYDIVLPEVERRGLIQKFLNEFCVQLKFGVFYSVDVWKGHTAPCDVQARCALAVLEDSQ